MPSLESENLLKQASPSDAVRLLAVHTVQVLDFDKPKPFQKSLECPNAVATDKISFGRTELPDGEEFQELRECLQILFRIEFDGSFALSELLKEIYCESPTELSDW
jgi:hypothetical protein